MSKKEDKITLEDLYWATLSKNDIIRVLKDNCTKNMVLEKQLEIKDQRIAEIEQENESYQKLINDICNKHRVASLKELDEMYQATTESLYASREYLEELKSEKWELEEQLKNKQSELDFSVQINRNKKRLYNIWVKINKRCFDDACEEYKNYGGRGITLCKEWQNLGGFYSFVIWALNNGYNPDLTIDRTDNNGNYEPLNCRWITRLEQNNNTRKNRFITAFGETDTLSNMARKYNVNVDCLWSRLSAGWNVEKALKTKIQSRNLKKQNWKN